MRNWSLTSKKNFPTKFSCYIYSSLLLEHVCINKFNTYINTNIITHNAVIGVYTLSDHKKQWQNKSISSKTYMGKLSKYMVSHYISWIAHQRQCRIILIICFTSYQSITYYKTYITSNMLPAGILHMTTCTVWVNIAMQVAGSKLLSQLYMYLHVNSSHSHAVSEQLTT